MAKFSKLWDIPTQELQNIFDTSSSWKEVLLRCGSNATTGGTYRTIKIVAKVQKIDLTVFEYNREKAVNENIKTIARKNSVYDYSKEFKENSTIPRSRIKKYIIKHNLIEYKCNECDNNGWHNGKLLILHLEHKNGVGNDHRLDNLCFLCPNCHSQTPTYAGRNSRKIPRESLKEKQIRYEKNRKFNPTKEELRLLIWKMPTTHIAKKYGVSDKAVAKRCKLFNLDKPSRGYWRNKEAAD